MPLHVANVVALSVSRVAVWARRSWLPKERSFWQYVAVFWVATFEMGGRSSVLTPDSILFEQAFAATHAISGLHGTEAGSSVAHLFWARVLVRAGRV